MATSSLAPQPAHVSGGRSNALAWWSAATILISAFLLFQVQPIISKKILPWFGGSPAVWTTCVLFFQLVLLGGYAYSHWLIKHAGIRRQGLIHASLLVLALLTLAFFPPADWWKPMDGNYPAMRIMRLLLVVVGATYFLLSTTGPLVQAWFAKLYPGRSPYRLYALSNVGSLAALISYPFFFETNLYVNTQGYLWAGAFVVFAALIGIMAFTMWREAGTLDEPAAEIVAQPAAPAAAEKKAKSPKPGAKPGKEVPPPVDSSPSGWLMVGWLMLAATATTALLAFTNHLCQDIAVVPFMWVIPLSLYLLTFIICFEYERWYFRTFFGIIALLSILWLSAIQNYGAVNDALEKPQRFFSALLFTPKFDNPDDAAAYRKKPFGKKMEDASPYSPTPFSRPTNAVFAGIGWMVNQVDLAAQSFSQDVQKKKRERIETWQKQVAADPENAPKEPTKTDEDWIKFECTCGEFKDHVVAVSTAYLGVLFLICLVCHGELVKSKPQPKYLTTFYLFISLGGALGGLFVALICPIIFKSHFEVALAMIGGFIVGWMAILNASRRGWLKSREVLQWVFAFVIVGTTLLVAKANIEAVEPARLLAIFPKPVQDWVKSLNLLPKADEDIIAMDRNFYGTVSVAKMGEYGVDPSNAGLALYNGRIWHGFQYQDPARHLEPTTYYVEGTGAALSVMQHPKRLAGQGMKIGVIGLGTGSMAAHGKAGDKMYFYDIDPKIVAFAHKYFTYLDTSPAKPEVILGDARIKMEQQLAEGSQNYDVIVLDAFSGDAIPAHLLTYESFALYDKHLHHDTQGQPDGVIVIHISNRYLDLEPVVYAIADKYGYDTVNVHASGDGSVADTASDWVLVSKNKEFINNPVVRAAGEPLKVAKPLLWTDQFTALFPILK